MRFGLLIALAASGIAAAPASAAFDTCTYDAGTKTVTAALTTSTTGELARNPAGAILADGVQCATATVTNTDKIVATGDATAGEAVTIKLDNGGFAPGATDEPGESDEIEIDVDLGAGSSQAVHAIGTAAVDHITLGTIGGPATLAGNLNANEVNGIDPDLRVISFTSNLFVDAAGGHDVLSDAGGPGHTVSTTRGRLQGGAGNDVHTVWGTALGGPGDDTYTFPSDDGFGFLSYESAPAPVTVVLTSPDGGGTAAGGDGFGGTDTYVRQVGPLTLSPHDDHFTAQGSADANVNGAAGNDDLQGGSTHNSLRGGDGNDILRGGNGGNTLIGNAGDDDLRGGDSADFLDMGAGDDTGTGGAGNDVYTHFASGFGADSMSGGPGRDYVYYSANACPNDKDDDFGLVSRASAVRVTLDGVADDGEAGEGDNVLPDMEDVVGTQHDDTIIGNDGDNLLTGLGGRDVLRGGGGADRLEGMREQCSPFPIDRETLIGDAGDDLDGGPGADVVNASLGDDVVAARDDAADTIDCGTGEDALVSDLIDAWSGCETVKAAALPPDEPQPPQPTPSPTPEPTATPAPPPVTVVKPPAPVTPPLPSVTSLIEQPPAKRCVSRRRLRLHVKRALRDQVASVTVFVNGKRKTRVVGRKLALPVDLRGLPKGRFTVRLEIALKDGRTAHDTRKYRTCAPRKRR